MIAIVFRLPAAFFELLPMNYQHKYNLIEAELNRVKGNKEKAVALYQAAIEGANKNKYLNEEALAYELAGKFYLIDNDIQNAQKCMRNACYAYESWGINAKVKHLRETYSQLFLTKTSSSSIASEALDLQSFLKASQVLEEEIVLDNLLKNLIKTLIENAGAEKGFIVFNKDKVLNKANAFNKDNSPNKTNTFDKDNTWVIKAEGTIDCNRVTILRSFSTDYVDPDTQKPLLPISIINYVLRSQEDLVLDNASLSKKYNDSYINFIRPKSVLCTPLFHQSRLAGLLYLENNQVIGAFTSERLKILKALFSQAAISIQNSNLYL